MSMQKIEQVPCWVRSFMCVFSILSVFGLIVAACLSADISIGISAVVGGIAYHTTKYAFNSST